MVNMTINIRNLRRNLSERLIYDAPNKQTHFATSNMSNVNRL